jgi:hypothetical protein
MTLASNFSFLYPFSQHLVLEQLLYFLAAFAPVLVATSYLLPNNLEIFSVDIFPAGQDPLDSRDPSTTENWSKFPQNSNLERWGLKNLHSTVYTVQLPTNCTVHIWDVFCFFSSNFLKHG